MRTEPSSSKKIPSILNYWALPQILLRGFKILLTPVLQYLLMLGTKKVNVSDRSSFSMKLCHPSFPSLPARFIWNSQSLVRYRSTATFGKVYAIWISENTIQFSANGSFFQLCGWGYCGMRAYLEALRVYSWNDFNIWTRSVHCFCQLCYLCWFIWTLQKW